jgi:hypothetical protein
VRRLFVSDSYCTETLSHSPARPLSPSNSTGEADKTFGPTGAWWCRLAAHSPVSRQPSRLHPLTLRLHRHPPSAGFVSAAPFDAAAAAAAAAAPLTPRAKPAAPRTMGKKALLQPELDWREQLPSMKGGALVHRKRLNPNVLRAGGDVKVESGPVLYWCSRDQRATDNWALLVRGRPPQVEPMFKRHR